MLNKISNLMEKFHMKENLNVLIFKLDKHIAMLEFSREQIFFYQSFLL